MNAPNDQVYRKYQGLVFQSRYRITDNWSINGQDTVQLQNYGDYEGEATQQRRAARRRSATIPEAFDAARAFPFGDLQNFERNRLRLWSIYNWQMGVARRPRRLGALACRDRASPSAWRRRTCR